VLRVFFTLSIFLLLDLYACKGSFEACKLKILQTDSIGVNSLSISFKNSTKLIFTRSTPHVKILKYDPFLSLYLVKSSKKDKYNFQISNIYKAKLASIDKKMAILGKIKRAQIGLNNLATFSDPLSFPSILVNQYCNVEGIVTKRGIIQKEYIKHFLDTKRVVYSDIGVRVKDIKKLVIVTEIDPFVDNKVFKKGDCIVSFDSKKIRNSAEFMRFVLFSKISSLHKIKIKRESKLLEFSLQTKERLGGGYLSDTFLEQKGIYFDENLKIIKLLKKIEKYNLKVGDKLVLVNGKKVNNQQDVRSNIESSSYLLFKRDGFEFFVKIR
jgi:hypothetical protein